MYDITVPQSQEWAGGNVRDWAMDTNLVAARVAYKFTPRPTCDHAEGVVVLSQDYRDKGVQAVRIHLEKAGVRLAVVLNTALQ